jgi:hypothetical protein
LRICWPFFLLTKFFPMARVKYGSLVTNIRGSIGGTTFQNNKYGFTAKNKGLPSSAGTTSQMQIRRNMLLVTNYWGQITEYQRSTWNAFAISHPQPIKSDSLIMLSGYALFLKYNLLMLSSGQGMQSEATDGVLPSPVIHPYVFYREGRLVCNPGGSPAIPTNWWLTSISPPMPFQLEYVRSPLRFLIILNQNEVLVDIHDYYLNLFGRLPASGATVWCKCVLTSGSIPQISSPSFFKVVVDSE